MDDRSPGRGPRIELRVLGELTVLREGEPLALPPSKKTRALLAYLALTARSHRRERLCPMFWDIADDPRGALRWSLTRIRPLVDTPEARRLIADRETVALELGADDVDLLRVRALVRKLDEASTDALEEAAAAFRGDLLEGLALPDFDAYEAWCLAEREDARRLRARIVRALVERHAADPERALPHARTLASIEPLEEDARAAFVRLLVGLGRRAEAAQEVESARRTFAELGLPTSGAIDAALNAPRLEGSPAPAAVEARPAKGARGASAAMMRSTVHGVRLVGREATLARLAAVLDDARDHRRARVIAVYGESGLGKSRLLVELLTEVRRRRGSLLEAKAFELERGRAYGPIVDALRRLPRSGIDDALAARLSPLLCREGAPGPSAESRDGVHEAMAELLRARARTGAPATLILDDAQWLDDASLGLLHYAMRACADEPLVIALALRSEELADNAALLRALRSFRRRGVLVEERLTPLDEAETTRLVRLVAPELEARTIAHESGGNPLFALELSRSKLSGVDALGGRLGDVVRERIERLPPVAIEVLRWASVLGTTFRVRHLAAVASAVAPDDLVAALEALEQHAMIGGVVDAADPGGTYVFGHELVRTVIYSDLSPPRRALMHRKVAEALSRDADPSASPVELAHHAQNAGDFAAAAASFAEAARGALRLAAPEHAAALARRGLSSLEHVAAEDRSKAAHELEAILEAAEDPARAPAARA